GLKEWAMKKMCPIAVRLAKKCDGTLATKIKEICDNL
uniref:U1-ectatotoxin-Et1b subunit B n=1 Tax=Ectatomma tuberculatum TaxID=39300 RepID=TX1BB_ECTTU|nr:RecName: Full=U1-ectatotoxin-Et1b subunit B; Short=U1-ECTX-Et1b subunit B; AltName: Full=Ectatomin-Et2 subunit B [Ectatomma tuberculatum]